LFYQTKQEEMMHEPESRSVSSQPTTGQPTEGKPELSTRQQKARMLSPWLETAKQIAKLLDEKESHTLWHILKIVKALGETQAMTLVNQALEIEANGGMMVPDQSRRRTPGGIFFHLVSTSGQPLEGQTLKQTASQKRSPDQQPGSCPTLPLQWEDRGAVLHDLQTAPATPTITLRGTIRQSVVKGAYIVGVLQSAETPSIPKGLPERPKSKTSYRIFMSAKQWKTIAPTLADAEDQLLLEGYPQINLQTGTVDVFVMKVTSKKQ
jgi:hypothetical protein